MCIRDRYGMFVAIVVPAAKAHRPVLGVAALAAALSCLVRYVPFLHAHISSGFSIILCTDVYKRQILMPMPVARPALVEGNGFAIYHARPNTV